MTEASDSADGPQQIEPDRVWDMLERIDIAMLVTCSHQGMRGRPMSTIPRKDRGDHVALHGQAAVDPDRALVQELWNPAVEEVFWPRGAEAHDVVALVVDRDEADVWDGHGLLRGIANIVRGAVKGRSPDLGTRGQVDL